MPALVQAFSSVMIRIEHLSYEFLHDRIFFIQIARLHELKLHICINFQAVAYVNFSIRA